MPMITYIGGKKNERCPIVMDPFLPKNIPTHNLWTVVVVGKAVPHEERLKNLERKRINKAIQTIS